MGGRERRQDDRTGGESEAVLPLRGDGFRGQHVYPLHERVDGPTQGSRAHHGRLPALRHVYDEAHLRPRARRQLRLCRRRRMDHRTYVHRLRAPAQRLLDPHVRVDAHVPRLWEVLASHPGTQDQRVLHGAHRHPLAHAGRQRARPQVRPQLAPGARIRRGAHQPRGLALVLRNRRQEPMHRRRHLLADRNGGHHHLQYSRHHAHETRILQLPSLRHRHRRTRSPDGRGAGGTRGGHGSHGRPTALAGHGAHVSRRPPPLPRHLHAALSRVLLHGRCVPPRRRRLHLDHRPHGRRPERLRPPDRHGGGGERAGGGGGGGAGGRRGDAARCQGGGHLRVRDAHGRVRGEPGAARDAPERRAERGGAVRKSGHGRADARSAHDQIGKNYEEGTEEDRQRRRGQPRGHQHPGESGSRPAPHRESRVHEEIEYNTMHSTRI
mmetsp:Transcript_38630/g.75362  ORF Transcript_38630/g.75362 Transcript_38630/m.75362 type:complete len:437 (+) Transcript_38630:759-2069(+)